LGGGGMGGGLGGGGLGGGGMGGGLGGGGLGGGLFGGHEPAVSAEPLGAKLLALERRCVDALGREGYELLHSLCLSEGGELARPLDIGAFPAPLRLMGEETLMMYVPVIEQVAFLHLQDLR